MCHLGSILGSHGNRRTRGIALFIKETFFAQFDAIGSDSWVEVEEGRAQRRACARGQRVVDAGGAGELGEVRDEGVLVQPLLLLHLPEGKVRCEEMGGEGMRGDDDERR